MRGKLLRFIVAWHTGPRPQDWYNTESDPIQFSQGVRQGCVLAPALYAAFLNPLFGDPPLLGDHPFPDLHAWAFSGGLSRTDGLFMAPPSQQNNWNPRRVPGQMYADDVGLLACTRLGLEDNLRRYHLYTCKWRSRLAPDKYHFVVFGAQLHHIQPLACPGGFLVQPEASAKYLGVTLDKARTSGPQLDQAKTKGRTQSHLSRTCSKLDMFYRLVGPPSARMGGPPAYSESAKLALVTDTRHRSYTFGMCDVDW